MMKRLLMGLMLLVTAGAAMGEWTFAANSEKVVLYVDRATIRRNGNLVKMWDLADLKTVQTGPGGESFLSLKTQEEYDCKEERSRQLAFTWFSGQLGGGKVVYSNDNVKDEWSPISPRSTRQTQWKIACGKK